jgi:hypothetical protein
MVFAVTTPWRLAAIAVSCAALGTACVDLWVEPVTEPLQNGRFPADAVTLVTAECYVVNEVARPLRALLAAARADGVGLTPETSSFLPPGVPGPPKIESCYRSYDGQVWWRNYYCSIGTCQNAAVPGSSKHGLGRAVDFQDQLGQLTFESPGYLWLAAHAAEYGFFQPANQQQGAAGEEAWHWQAS